MHETWNTIDIAGKPADVYDPPGGPPQFGILFLHPHGEETLRHPLAQAFVPWLETFRFACVCPHGRKLWWTDHRHPSFDPVLSPEEYLLKHVLPYFGVRWKIASRAIGLAGISMGGQAALRLAFKHPDLFPVVGAISSAIDYHELYGQGMGLDDLYDSKEQCRQDTALLHIHPNHYPPHIFFAIDPDDEPWYRGNDRLHEKLSALGVEHTCDLTTRAGGHSWQYFGSMAERMFRFIHTGLEQESRRLL